MKEVLWGFIHPCLHSDVQQYCSRKLIGLGDNDLYLSSIKLEHWKENHAFNTFQNRNIWKKVNSLFCFLVFSSCLFFLWMDCLILGKPRCACSESRQMKSNDLLLSAAYQTVSVKSNFSLNKTGALVFSALHLLWDIIIARMPA